MMYVAASNEVKASRIMIQLTEHTFDVGAIERYMDDGIRPSKEISKLIRRRRHSEHDCACRGALVESARNLLPLAGVLRLIDAAAVGDVVATRLQQLGQEEPMLAMILHSERALLLLLADSACKCVVVIKPLAYTGFTQQRLMGDCGAPTNVADVNETRRGCRFGAKAQNIGGEWQVAAGTADDSSHLVDTMFHTDKHMVELVKKL